MADKALLEVLMNIFVKTMRKEKEPNSKSQGKKDDTRRSSKLHT